MAWRRRPNLNHSEQRVEERRRFGEFGLWMIQTSSQRIMSPQKAVSKLGELSITC
jgi:hypothetical protein